MYKQSHLISYLYDKFYKEFDEYSNVTSSHWRVIGGHHVVPKGEELLLKGVGFGGFSEDIVINKIKYSYYNLLISSMKRKMRCNDKLWKLGKEVAKKQGRLFDFDCAKQVLAIDYLLKRLDVENFSSADINRVCVIGDGYGYMTSLMYEFEPSLEVTCVNLGRSLIFDVYYSTLSSDCRVGVIDEGGVNNNNNINFIPAENYSIIQKIKQQDLFINIASMQEMDLPIVNNYLRFMRDERHNSPLFYCCNRISKRLPDGGVICFDDYGWRADDTIIFDELCEWYQRYPKTVPFGWRDFDGPIRHKLVYLNSR